LEKKFFEIMGEADGIIKELEGEEMSDENAKKRHDYALMLLQKLREMLEKEGKITIVSLQNGRIVEEDLDLSKYE
jgi:hypothetical protein